MTLKIRFIILLAILSGGLITGILVLSHYEKRESTLIMAKVREQRSDLLDRVLTLHGDSLTKFVYEYAQWTEMVKFVEAAEPDLEWAEVNLYDALSIYDAAVVWTLRADGSAFYDVEAENFPAVHVPVMPPKAELLGMFDNSNEIHFFYAAPDGIYEVRGGIIVQSAGWEESNVPHGYLIVARHWDENHLNKLSKLLDSHLKLLTPGEVSQGDPGRFGFQLQRDLKDMHGQTLRVFEANYNSLELMQAVDGDRWEAAIFIIYGSLAIIIVVLFVYQWVLKPLRKISYALSTSDVGPLTQLLNEKSELGRVANLVKSAFHDREELRLALEERARLGRDLHDGVIQTLYASGMSLASIQTIMHKSPLEAENLLDQTRRELNATIRDVRNFITRLEPESGNIQRFDRALETLLEFMKGGLNVQCIVSVDEGLSSRLPMDIRAQLLQIIREAASNAFRHSGCTELRVSLQEESGEMVLTIADNGKGFDPGKVSHNGQGLRNFRERTEEIAGKLDIFSKPGNGAVISVTTPIHKNL
jgi:signal transduction histidine kinase